MAEKSGSRARRLRCAIYTRKSSEEGLEQEFNSLHAQREACEAYIASQRSEGWVLVRDQYDDGGISGGTLDRPALQRLLADIEAVIRRFVRRHLAQLEDCYVKELAAHPDLAGTVDTRWLIQPDGKVGMCNAKGVSDEVASCVCGAIKAIEFPKPKGGGPVNITSYPFTFSPKPS